MNRKMITILRIVRILVIALCVCIAVLGCYTKLSPFTGQFVDNRYEEIKAGRILCTVNRWINAVHGTWRYTSQNDILIIRSPALRLERENENLRINNRQVLKPGESLQYKDYFFANPWNVAKITLVNNGLVDDTLRVNCSYYVGFDLFKGTVILLICLLFLFLISRKIKTHNRTIKQT